MTASRRTVMTPLGGLRQPLPLDRCDGQRQHRLGWVPTLMNGGNGDDTVFVDTWDKAIVFTFAGTP